MLSTLEGRLGAAESAYPALVFYQLRRLWQSGRELITQLVADLVRQQEERERRAHLAQHNRSQFAGREDAENQLRAAQALHAQATAQLAALEAERAQLTRFWHYFKRRALERRVAAAEAAVASAGGSLGQAQLAVEEIARNATPEFQGLSLPARRAINLAAIAYAEALCVRLTQLKSPMLTLARAVFCGGCGRAPVTMSAMTWAACSSTTSAASSLDLSSSSTLFSAGRFFAARRLFSRASRSLWTRVRSSRRALRLSDTLCCPRTESMAAMSDTSQR